MSNSQDPAKSIFLNALEISAGPQRLQFIDEQCAENKALRLEVDRLLNASENAANFMESPPADVGGESTLDHAFAEPPGSQIGPYKLMEQIGEGGMGVVYVAKQERPMRRRVALKVIKPGMDSKEVISRFEAERQALALMDHPNIAKVYDAGTTQSGRPYFVMELVRGIPITEYCDLGRFSAGQRLEVFVQVCQAVQHAHQKGVIHRDIKPSNVLITEHDGTPVVKVIDFGVAKAVNQQLSDCTIYTRHRQMVGTPLYMSPEQAELSALDVDTRSDIYSLGVLLYELLTGATPFDKQRLHQAAFDEIRRIIREEEPSKPSTKIRTMGNTATSVSGNRSTNPDRLCRALRGDLDWIVMKCLEKDRARRYDTANGLAMDLQRHLNNEPVTARPPSMTYRLQKAWQRNKAVCATGAAVLTALVFGLSLAAVGWRQARQRGDAAVLAQAGEARQRLLAQQSESRAQKARDEAIVLKENARLRAYAAEMNIAFQADAENNLFRMRELLDGQRPESGEKDLRGFEWRYLWSLCRGDEIARFPNTGSNDVCFSPDGSMAAFAGPRGVVIRDVVSRSQIQTLPTDALTVSFSPRDDLLVSANRSRTTLWNTTNWEKVRSLPDSTCPAVFSPDGKWLVTASKKKGFRLWNTDTWEQAGHCPFGGAGDIWFFRHAAAFSPDSKLLCTPSLREESAFTVWKLPSLEPLPDFVGPPEWLTSAVFLPDGKRLVTTHFGTGDVFVWDVAAAKLVETLHGHDAWATTIDASADGSIFATGSCDRSIVIWDAKSFQPVTSLRGHLAEVWGLAFSPDGRVLATSSQGGTGMLWDASKRHLPVEAPGEARSFGFLEKGRLIVTATPLDTVQVYDTVDNRIVDQIQLTDTESIRGVAVRPSSTRESLELALSRVDGSVELWSKNAGRINSWAVFNRHALKRRNILERLFTFSPDGKFLAALSLSGSVRLLRLSDRQEVSRFEADVKDPWRLAFSSGSKLLACCGSSAFVNVWNVEEGRQVQKLGPHNGIVDAVSFSPDGRLLATGTRQSNEVVLWDLASGQMIRPLRGHLNGISTVDFSADGRTLATGSGDRRVKLWNVATCQQITTLTIDGWVWEVAFSPDGRSLAVQYAGEDGRRVRLVHAPTWKEIQATESSSAPPH